MTRSRCALSASTLFAIFSTLAFLRYQDGLGTFLDVLNAPAQLAQTRTNLANAEFLHRTGLAQLVRATGGH